MPVTIIVGGQWGDEGKGKVVDYLTERASMVVRFQGGNNAGHTVVVDGRKTALKLFPSGILRGHVRCLLAPAVVVAPEAFLDEWRLLEEAGIEITPERLGLAPEINLIMPYHRAVDSAREAALAEERIGTTGKGIGPAYEDLVARSGVRICDLFDSERLKSIVSQNVEAKKAYLKYVLESEGEPDFGEEEILCRLEKFAAKIEPYVTRVNVEIYKAIETGKGVIFEGAQGCLLDIIHGTYPFVTSSNTIASAACVSAGVDPRRIDCIMGIFKAYCTRVGGGPFPSEDSGEDGDAMRERGVEFGTVTGRPRRCGWFDAVAARRSILLNGIDSVVLTKIDVLDGFSRIRICTGYEIDGKTVDEFPSSVVELAKVRPVYEDMDGWCTALGGVRSFDELPAAAIEFLERLEELLGCKIGGVSVGPEREQFVER